MKLDYTGKYVLVRSRDAGVHFGEYLFHTDSEVHLKNSQRIWRWRGANTLNEIAENGVNRDEYTRISKKVDSIIIMNFCELIVMKEKSLATMGEIWG